MSVLTKALDSGASWVLDLGLRDGQSICFNGNKHMMVFSKNRPEKADTPSCLSDVSFTHLLSNSFPSLRHFTSSLQSWFKVSFSVKHSFSTGHGFEGWIEHLWSGRGHSLKQACCFSVESSGKRADELGPLVSSYLSCLADYSHFFPVKQNLEDLWTVSITKQLITCYCCVVSFGLGSFVWTKILVCSMTGTWRKIYRSSSFKDSTFQNAH